MTIFHCFLDVSANTYAFIGNESAFVVTRYFVYYGQTERPNRIAEHRKPVSSFDHNSKVAGHVHNLNHNMDFENTKVVGLEANYHERLFLETWHSRSRSHKPKTRHFQMGAQHTILKLKVLVVLVHQFYELKRILLKKRSIFNFPRVRFWKPF